MVSQGKKTQAVEIHGVRPETFSMKIVGTTPLLSNRFPERQMELIEKRQQGKARGKLPPKDPQALYEESIHYTEDGRPGFPASGIKQACVYACRFLDMAMTEARGAFFVMGGILPIDGTPRMHKSVVKIKPNIADIRYRAEYPEWSITFDVKYNPDIITQESIVNIVETAGFHIGLGDWRPGKSGGTNGMFKVTRE